MGTQLDINKLARLKELVEMLKKVNFIKDQGDIAEKLGYARKQTISDIVTGRSTLTTKFVRAFCGAYGLSEEYLLKGKGPIFLGKDILEEERKPQTVDTLIDKTKIEEKVNEGLTSALHSHDTKTDDNMYRLIDAIQRIANANETLANTNSDVVRELLTYRGVEKQKHG